MIEVLNEFCPKALTQDNELATKSPEKLLVFNLTSFPYKPAGLNVVQLNVDYKELLQCLRNKKSLKRVSVKNVTIAFRIINQKQIEIDIRLLSPLSEKLLDMCDGSRTVSDIIYQFSLSKGHVDGVPAEKVCFFGLSQLFKQELIEVSSRPIKKNAHFASSAVKMGDYKPRNDLI